MVNNFGQTCRGTRWEALLLLCLVAFPGVASADAVSSPGFLLRNQNPFLQIFGLPPFQSAQLATPGRLKYDLSLDIANHADAGDNDVEDFAIDGESYFLTLSLRRRVLDRLELGVDLPLVAHADGFLDNTIESWHDTFGMSNTKRRGPSNQLGFEYSRDGNLLYQLDSATFGLGDIQISAAMPLRESQGDDRRSITLRSSIKLPTGDADELSGSGAADLSLGIYAADRRTFWRRDLELAGFAGALLLGDGDVLGGLQKSAVPFGGVSATWWAMHNLGISAQLYAQGKYFDSDLEELGGNSVQLAVGGEFRLPQRGLSLLLAVVEDVSANATTDFALHFSARKTVGK
ncbi:MAG: DUF3187 family protein [Woeseiaceae bacterium]|nr:DUF3187 family protein [Woeseiaceae bacterium]